MKTLKLSELSLAFKINLGLVAGLMILIAVGVVSVVNRDALDRATSGREHAMKAKLASTQLLSDLINVETGQRGYVLTGQTSYLQPYDQAAVRLDAAISNLLILTPDATDRQLVSDINNLAKEKLAELHQTITLRQTKGFAAAQAVVLTGQGKTYMDQIRAKMTTLNANEDRAIVNYATQSGQLQRQTTLVVEAGILLSVLVVASAIWIINRDLTARKRAEDELAEQEARLKAVINSMTEGLVVADLHGTFTLFNAAAEEILGVGLLKISPDKWAKSYGNYLPDKTTPFPAEQFPLVRALKGDEARDVEIYVKNKQLKTGKFISVSGNALRDANGHITGSIAVFNDITQRKDAETKLFAEKAKAEAMLGSIGDGVFALDTEERIVLFNRAAEQLTGFTLQEALGRPYTDILEFYSEKDGRPVDEFIKTALKGWTAAMTQDTWLRRKDGTPIPVADSAAPILGVDDEVQGAVVVFRNVVREKELERLKDDFVSIASHELRTPMGAIRAFVSMILDGDYGPVNKNLVEPLTDIRGSTLRLVELVNDMLNVARIEAGRMKFEVTDQPLDAILHEVMVVMTPLAKEKKLELNYLPPKTSVMVLADPGKVNQVLTNLLGNALKFTDTGGITVKAVAKHDFVEITVVDTGLGISSEDQPKLFGKFQQISSNQTGRPAGTGLGLYISREIIRKMGGDLWIKHSALDKGSEFAFTVVRAKTAAAKQVQERLAREASIHPDQK